MGDTEVALLARRRQTRWWWWGFALYVVVIPVAVLVGYVFGGDDGPDRAFWWFLLFVTGVAVVYASLLIAFVLWRRRRGARWAQPPLMLGVGRARRKSILKQVRAGDRVPEDDQAIAADVAHRLARQGKFVYASPVLVLIWIIQLVSRGFDFWSGFLVVAIGLMCISVPYTLRDAGRGRAWLQKYSVD